MEDAVQAARRIIAVDEGAPDADDDFEYLDIITVARAYLAARPSIIEQCAKVADRHQAQALDSRTAQAALNISRAIRSLKEKDGQ